MKRNIMVNQINEADNVDYIPLNEFKSLAYYEALFLKDPQLAPIIQENICIIADNLGDGESNWDDVPSDILRDIPFGRMDLETFDSSQTTADYFIIFVHYVGSSELANLIKTLVENKKFHQLNIYNNETFYEFDKHFKDIPNDPYLEFLNYDEQDTYLIEVDTEQCLFFAGDTPNFDYLMGTHEGVLKKACSSPTCLNLIIEIKSKTPRKLVFKCQNFPKLVNTTINCNGNSSSITFECCNIGPSGLPVV